MDGQQINTHWPMIVGIAKSVWHETCGLGLPELIQAGRVGLWMATFGYDNAIASFRTYAQHRVRGEMLDQIEKARLGPRRVRYEHVPLTEFNGGSYVSDTAERWEAIEQAMVRLKRLPQRDQDVLHAYFDCGEHMKDIGRRYGISESRVCQMVSAAIQKLRCC